MKTVAILASDDMMPDCENPREDSFERDEQMAKLKPAFAAVGLRLDLIRWREAVKNAVNYDAMLPLFVWDYFQDKGSSFLTEMAGLPPSTALFNPLPVLRWNLDKSYLCAN